MKSEILRAIITSSHPSPLVVHDAMTTALLLHLYTLPQARSPDTLIAYDVLTPFVVADRAVIMEEKR
jgi:hypothetical protein